VVFLEPIALYRQKDLHEPGDRLWLSPFSDVNEQIRLGELGVRGDGGDLAILSYGNGFFYSCKAEKILADYGVSVKLIDLRWLAPIDYVALEKEIGDIRCVLIVDECRQSGALSEALIANLHSLQGKSFARVTAEDCFITLGESWKTLLPDEHQIVTAAKALLQSTR
jgi:2-oxoisovalerate dehydrogenase E1 component